MAGYEIPTKPSPFSRNDGDPKKGGTGLRVTRAKPETWREYSFEFTILHPLASPYFYIEHQVKVANQWKTVYCLGTPPAFTNGRIEPDPMGVEKCMSIIVPGYNTPLHTCVEDMGSENARTQAKYGFIILNWTTGAVQLMDVAENSLTKYFEYLQTEAQHKGKVDLLGLTWEWSCEPSGGMWKNIIEATHPSAFRTKDDIAAVWGKNDLQKRFDKCQEFFSRAQTFDQIRESLGSAPAGGNAPPFAAGSDDDSFSPPITGGGAPAAPAPVFPGAGVAPAEDVLPFLQTGAPSPVSAL